MLVKKFFHAVVLLCIATMVLKTENLRANLRLKDVSIVSNNKELSINKNLFTYDFQSHSVSHKFSNLDSSVSNFLGTSNFVNKFLEASQCTPSTYSSSYPSIRFVSGNFVKEIFYNYPHFPIARSLTGIDYMLDVYSANLITLKSLPFFVSIANDDELIN